MHVRTCGTVGGLMAGTCMPYSFRSRLASPTASASPPTTKGTIGLRAGTPKPAPKRSTSDHKPARLQYSLRLMHVTMPHNFLVSQPLQSAHSCMLKGLVDKLQPPATARYPIRQKLQPDKMSNKEK